MEKRSLTAQQIQYLRMGPKTGGSPTVGRQVQEALNQFGVDGADGSSPLASIPRFSCGYFEQTVNNFGVLLHRNFEGTSTISQTQKFGAIALEGDRIMQAEHDKPAEPRRGRALLSDTRTSLKTIHDYHGHRLTVTLHSFSIESVQTHRTLETLPLLFLKLLASHVPTNKLIKTIELAMKQEGSTVTIDYERMDAKVGRTDNPEPKYSDTPLEFEKSGQKLTLIFPRLEISHADTDYKQLSTLENKQLLQSIDSDFDNADKLFAKYFNPHNFDSHLKTAKQLPPSDQD